MASPTEIALPDPRGPPNTSAPQSAPPPLPPKPAELRAPALPRLPPRYPLSGHRRSKSGSAAPSTSSPLLPPPLPPRPQTTKVESSRRLDDEQSDETSELFSALLRGNEAKAHGSEDLFQRRIQRDPVDPEDDGLWTLQEAHPSFAFESKPPPLPPRPHETQVTTAQLLRENDDTNDTATDMSISTEKNGYNTDEGSLQSSILENGATSCHAARHVPKNDIERLENGLTTEKSKNEKTLKKKHISASSEAHIPLPFPRPLVDFVAKSKIYAGSQSSTQIPSDSLCLVQSGPRLKQRRKSEFAIDLGDLIYKPREKEHNPSISCDEVERIQDNLITSSWDEDECDGNTPVARKNSARRIAELAIDNFRDNKFEDAEFMIDVTVRKLLEQDDRGSRIFAFTFLSMFSEHARHSETMMMRMTIDRCLTLVLSRIIESLIKTDEPDDFVWRQAIYCALGMTFWSGSSLSLLALFGLGKHIVREIHPFVENELVGVRFAEAAGLNASATQPVLRTNVNAEILYNTIGGFDKLLDLFLLARSRRTRMNLFHLILEVVVTRVLQRGEPEKDIEEKSKQANCLCAIFRSYRMYEAFYMQMRNQSPSFALDCVRVMFIEPLTRQGSYLTSQEEKYWDAVLTANRHIDKGFVMDVLNELEELSIDYATRCRRQDSQDTLSLHCKELEKLVVGSWRNRSEALQRGVLLRAALARAIESSENTEDALEVSEVLLSFILLPCHASDIEIDSEALAFLEGKRGVPRATVSALEDQCFVKLLYALAPRWKEHYVSEIRQALLELLGMNNKSSRDISTFVHDDDPLVAERARYLETRLKLSNGNGRGGENDKHRSTNT